MKSLKKFLAWGIVLATMFSGTIAAAPTYAASAITGVDLVGFSKPVQGQKATDNLSGVDVPAGANYRIENLYWVRYIAPAAKYINTHSKNLSGNDVFEASYSYYLYVEFRANDGYEFNTSYSGVKIGGTNKNINKTLLEENNTLLRVYSIYYNFFGVKRISGANRVETSVNISQEMLSYSDTVVLASGDSYADALAGVTLAASFKAPILLVQKNKGLQNSVLDEISRLGAANVIILGGENSIPLSVETALSAKGLSVKRVAGTNRYGTAVAIAEETYKKYANPHPDALVFVSGSNYPDALSISGIAGQECMPILYIGKDGVLDSVTKEYMDKTVAAGKVKIIIIGGTGSISSAAEENLKKYDSNSSVERISGSNRYETCLKINEYYGAAFTVCVATGQSFPDALAGAVYCALCRTPLILVPSSGTESAIANQISAMKKMAPERILIFGGEASVSKAYADCMNFGKQPSPLLPPIFY